MEQFVRSKVAIKCQTLYSNERFGLKRNEIHLWRRESFIEKAITENLTFRIAVESRAKHFIVFSPY